MNRVSIILLNWNGWQDTIECLESLLLLEYPEFCLVVCDNGSTDDSLYQIRQWVKDQGISCREYGRAEAESGGDLSADPMLTLICNNENLGFAGGNNVGLRYVMARTDSEWCWLLNNDTVVECDALSCMVSRMKEKPEIGICGSTVLHYHDRDRIQALGGGHYCRWIGLPWHYGRFTRWTGQANQLQAESWMNYVEGASMLVSRRFIEQVGLMSEEYFLYFEEADWAIRAKERFRLGYAPASVVYHKIGASIGTSSNPMKKSYTCDYYSVRNRLLFTRRFYPVALPTVCLVLAGEIAIRLFCGELRRAVIIFRLMLRWGNDLENRL